MINIQLNGEPQQVAAQCSISQLLQNLALDVQRIAVERNQKILPKSQYANTYLTAGDQLEIIQAIGGG
jgi:sulfur carrier protein